MLLIKQPIEIKLKLVSFKTIKNKQLHMLMTTMIITIVNNMYQNNKNKFTKQSCLMCCIILQNRFSEYS